MFGHIGESTISSYFRDGHRQPSMRVVVGLASALGIPVAELRELAALDDGRGRRFGGGDTPMAALIDSASVLHGDASHQVLARIARQGGHEISSSTGTSWARYASKESATNDSMLGSSSSVSITTTAGSVLNPTESVGDCR